MRKTNCDMMTPEEIMRDTEDGQVYTAIFDTFRVQMERVLGNYSIESAEERYDYLMDFYLHLRDDKNGPYHAYLTIRAEHKEASRAQWLRTTFRNYMNRRFVEKLPSLDGNEELVEEEDSFAVRDVRMAVDVLDRVNKTFPAPERVVFFYDLWAVSYDEKFPTEKVTEMLGCTEGNLRVMKHRVRNKVKRVVKSLEERL